MATAFGDRPWPVQYAALRMARGLEKVLLHILELMQWLGDGSGTGRFVGPQWLWCPPN